MRTMLFVSYYYPPGFPVGHERVMKFRKYLPEFGYRTCVLGTRVLGTSPTDQPECVYRTGEVAMLYRALLRKVVKRSEDRSERPAPRGITEGSRIQGFRDWLLEWFFIPDLHVLWFPFAVWRGVRVIRRENVDVILSTSGPETNHLVGLALSLLTGKPLIADFRDGWLFEPLRPFMRRNRFRRSIDGLLERWVVRRAEAVTTVSDPITEYFRRRYELDSERAVTITNGFDPDDWIGVEPKERTDSKFRIVNTGSFGLSRSTTDPVAFFDALAQLPLDVRARIEVLLLGNLSGQEKRAVDDRALSDIVSFIPTVPKKEALGYQLSADLLLLAIGSDISVATTKLFEYLYARRPILAVGPEAAAASQIIRRVGAGESRSPDNPAAIAAFITNLVRNGRRMETAQGPAAPLAPYERRQLAGSLASLADRLTNARSETPTGKLLISEGESSAP